LGKNGNTRERATEEAKSKRSKDVGEDREKRGKARKRNRGLERRETGGASGNNNHNTWERKRKNEKER